MNSPGTLMETAETREQRYRIAFTPFDQAGMFLGGAEGQELRRLAVRGVSVITLAQLGGLALQFSSTLILARLLLPSDFGVVTMVTTFSLLFLNAGSNGFTEAVLQSDKVEHGLVSNLFWINVGAGLVLTIAFGMAGSALAWFYGNHQVIQVAVGMAPTILITSTSALHLALLMRAMRFSVVYVNQILSRLIGIAVSVLLAVAGWGYWALVGGAVVQPLSEAVGAWLLCRWIPGRPRRVDGTAPMVRFALHVYGRFGFNYFSRNTDNVLVGWRFNAQSLGYYKKAYDLFALSEIIKSLTPVAISTLSRLRDRPQDYRRSVLKVLAQAAFLGMGVGGLVTLAGRDLIRVLLGPQWHMAGYIFTFFGPGFGIMFIYSVHAWIHLSLGKPHRWLLWGIFEFVVTALLFVLALPWGATGIAASWSVSLLILTLAALWYAGKPISLGVPAIVAAVWKFFLAALLAGCTSTLIVAKSGMMMPASDLVSAAVRIGKVTLLFSPLYIVGVAVLHRSWAPVRQLAGVLRELSPWRNSTGAAQPGNA